MMALTAVCGRLVSHGVLRLHPRWLSSFGICVIVALTSTAARAADELASRLSAAAPDANPVVLQLAARAADCAHRKGELAAVGNLAVIDYSRPSSERRLWVFDAARGRLLFEELVAHGRGTGDRLAEKFSNSEGSHMTSLGLFRTADAYQGSNGYSLRLLGLEKGTNDNALARAIVMHGAPYVSEAFVERIGRIGRSWGCPALRPEIAHSVIDTLKGGAAVFAYYPDTQWLRRSQYLSCDATPAG
jgi:hypothetical protein